MKDPKNWSDWSNRNEEIDEDFDDPVWDFEPFADTEEELNVWEPNDNYNE